MCGIWLYLKYHSYSNHELMYKNYAEFNKRRGPDLSYYSVLPNNFGEIAFYRLKINDISDKGNQPFVIVDKNKNVNKMLICNGEIYNHLQLKDKYKIKTFGNSDCEVIIWLLQQMSFPEMLKQLDGVFSLIYIDFEKKLIFAARDQFGRRMLYIGESTFGIFFSSVMKGLDFCDNVKQFPPRTWWCSSEPHIFKSYYELPIHYTYIIPQTTIIRNLLIEAVKKRINNTNRNLGFFLSGGLDSSLICCIANKLFKMKNPSHKITTFSIGTHPNAPDLTAARIVSKFLGTIHHEVIMTTEDAIAMIPKVISCIESFDCTTVRASIGQYVLSKYISKKTNIKVMLSGEFSDELFYGYKYHSLAPSAEEAQIESTRLLENIHYFDVLRAEKTTSHWGLEVRVPFADIPFLEYCYQIDPKFKHKPDSIEKNLLRNSFKGYLPEDILYRKKDAFSDAIGYNMRTAIIEFCNKKITDKQMKFADKLFPHLTPKTKEEFYYRCQYAKHFFHDEIIPYKWMPKWVNSDVIDPSATIL